YMRVTVGTDGEAFSVAGERYMTPHPRSFGTFPRVLGKYVRKEKVLSQEDAVYKMTYLPSLIVGLFDRGSIDEGKKADLVIFDPKTVIDTATFKEPYSYPRGISYVLVNGKVALHKNKMQGYFGKYLKHGSSSL
ncbi:MAG: amidohydrolase family protein, partial [Candidatus Firestonebacteria bacterium]